MPMEFSSTSLRAITPFLGLSVFLFACGTSDVVTTVPQSVVVPGIDEVETSCTTGETDGDLNLYNWDEYVDPELVVAFEEEFAVDVVQDTYQSNEVMYAKLQSGASYDLIVPSDYMVTILIREAAITKIQREAVPNLRNLDPLFADPLYDPGGTYSVAYQWGTSGIAVSNDLLDQGLEPTWGMVFDPELIAGYPSGVSLLDDSRETLGAALKYLGYSINSTSEVELRQAAAVIERARPFVATFDSISYADSLVTGRIDVAHGYSGDFFASFSEGGRSDAFQYVIPVEGATLWADNLSIPTNAEHPCTAHTFINFILDAENGAALTNWTFYASPNAAATAFIDSEILNNELIYPSEEVIPLLEVMTDTGEFEVRYLEYFATVKS